MRRHIVLGLIGSTVFMAPLAGCTTTSQGQPLPPLTGTSETTTMDTSETSPPRSTSPSNAELPSDGAPKVKNPLDTTRFHRNPCQALAQAQLQQLNLPAQGEQRETPLGLACNWFNPDTGGAVGFGFPYEDPRGLSAIYKANKAGKYKYFIELPEIEGYPAVASSGSDGRDQGACSVQVGTSDQFSFYLSLQLSLRNIGQKDPCEVAVQVVAMTLQTMKAGG